MPIHNTMFLFKFRTAVYGPCFPVAQDMTFMETGCPTLGKVSNFSLFKNQNLFGLCPILIGLIMFWECKL